MIIPELKNKLFTFLSLFNLLLGALASMPLLIFLLGIYYASHTLNWDWKWVFIIILLTIYFLFYSVVCGSKFHYQMINELVSTISKFGYPKFKRIDTDHYLLLLAKQLNISLDTDSDFKSFANRILPTSLQNKKENIRILRFEDEHYYCAYPQNAAFSTPFATWIILKDDPTEMTGINHFQLLHEIGHASLASSSMAFLPYFIRSKIISFVILVFFFIDLNFPSILILTILWGIIFILIDQFQKIALYNSKDIDEFHADYFAFLRSNKNWFKIYQKNIDLLANIYVSSSIKKDSQKKVEYELKNSIFGRIFLKRALESSKFQDIIERRKQVFIENVNRLLSDQKPILDFKELAPFRDSITNISNVYAFILWTSIICVAFLSGTLTAELTTLRFTIISSLLILSIFFIIVHAQALVSLGKVLDYRLGIDTLDKKAGRAVYYWINILNNNKYVNNSDLLTNHGKYFHREKVDSNLKHLNSTINVKYTCLKCKKESFISELHYDQKIMVVSCDRCLSKVPYNIEKHFKKLMDL